MRNFKKSRGGASSPPLWFLLAVLLLAFLPAVVIEQLPASAGKVVALTFDDGPKNGPTEDLLQLLRKEKVKATFFVIGRSIKDDPDLILRIQREGHDLGGHTSNHARLDTLSAEDISREIRTGVEQITAITKQPVKYFRAPGGRYSREVYRQAAKQNLKVINWSLNTGDYMMDAPLFEKGEAVFVRTDEMIEEDVLRRVKAGDIILMHNGNIETNNALRKLIPELKKQGYRFVKISEFY